MPKFEYLSCESIEEACSLLGKYGEEARVLSGGTDLLIKMKHKMMTPGYLINIKRIPDLNYIRQDDGRQVAIGALTTVQAVKNSPLIKKKYHALNDATGVLGTRQVRNLATVCGNLCNASPAAECAPALLALNARARIAGKSGRRVIDLKDFFLEPGKIALAHDEILTEIQIPEPETNTGGVYLKHSTRRIDVAIVGVAVVVRMDGPKVEDIRIALGAVGPTPFRAEKAEAILKGRKADEERVQKAAAMASDESFPIDDLRGQKDYRKEMVATLVKQGIEGAISRAR
ncbi:MAG: xanthine dehydrogenase family protein subunit M [Deltaproteobacteria bacterium]|nr:xanthine dehydrogenase family protein subunit M [Deltaproteobacteria bacterium]